MLLPIPLLGSLLSKLLYGYPPRHFGISVFDDVAVPELSTWLQNRQVISELIKQHVARAKERMKRQADKNRSERSFQVGEGFCEDPTVCSNISGSSCQPEVIVQILWTV